MAPAARAGAPSDERQDVANVQVVELYFDEAAADDATKFERVLAENGIALNTEALTVERGEDDVASSLTAADSILVEATPAQLKKVLTGYQGRAVAAGETRLSGGLETLVRQSASSDASSSSNEFKAMADWASRAADKAKNERGAGAPPSGEAWRLVLTDDVRTRRSLEAPVRVAQDSPASTSSSAASSQRSYSASPASEPTRGATRRSELDRMKAVTDGNEGPPIRMLFRFRTAPQESQAAPGEQ
jgi:hypothetical protein